jgi:DNA-binding MarR family transcriptional regulator
VTQALADDSPRTNRPATTVAGPVATVVSAELAQSLRLSIARLARLLRQQDRTGHGATLTAALASVARHGGPTHGELAAMEQVAPPTITAVVGKMETLGLVTREADPNDRRITRIRATPAGQELLADTRNRRTQWLQTQMSYLAPDEIATLEAAAAVLAKLTIAPPSGPEPTSIEGRS